MKSREELIIEAAEVHYAIKGHRQNEKEGFAEGARWAFEQSDEGSRRGLHITNNILTQKDRRIRELEEEAERFQKYTVAGYETMLTELRGKVETLETVLRAIKSYANKEVGLDNDTTLEQILYLTQGALVKKLESEGL
jgi:uncharacterized coiled-coil protein SlyX